jgi:hypothetical protein
MGWSYDEWEAAYRALQAHGAALIKDFPVAGSGGGATAGS